MSEILSNIVVEQNNINFSPDNNNINITPEAIQLNIFTAGGGGIGNSNVGELLYNNNFVVDGVPNTLYANGNLTLGNVSNIRINGGTNGYVLQTDGTGNLTWTAQTGGGGNGSPGGANTQIQYNDSGSFGGSPGFTFDEVTGNVNMPANLIVAGTIYGNANYALNAGNVLIANQPNITGLGTLTSLTVNGTSTLGPIGNVKIGGGSNAQSIVTDGSNNLSFATRADPTWANVATIGIGGIFIGKSYGPNTTVTYTGPGNTFTSNATTSFSSSDYIYPLTTLVGNVGNLNGIDGYMFAASDTANYIGRNNPNDLTASWTGVITPLQPHKAPVKGANNIVIFATNSNRAAYSTNLGNTWSNSAALPNSGQWQDIAYGNGVFVISTQQAGYNYVAVSADDGLTWGQYQVSSGNTNRNYRNIAYGNGAFYMIAGSAPTLLYKSTDNGQTWGTVTIPGPIQDLTYGNGTLVAVKGNTVPYSPGGAYYSTDNGNSWSSGAMSNIGWSSVTYADPYFVASATGSNVIAYSTDGNSWSYGNIPGQGGETGWDSKKRILAFSNATAPDGYVSIFQSTALYVDGSDGTGGANLQIVPNGTYKMLGGVGGNTGAMWSRVT